MSADGALLIEPLDTSSYWLVVRAKTLRERLAADHLRERGVEPYVPLFLEPRWHRRAPRGPVPLFPGYLFVRCVPASDLPAVRFSPGVSGPVAFGGRLAAVGESVVAALRQLEGERGYIEPKEIVRKPRRGQKVRVVQGPLKGIEGVFEGSLRGGERAMILVEFLRSRRPVEVEMLAIEPVSA